MALSVNQHAFAQVIFSLKDYKLTDEIRDYDQVKIQNNEIPEFEWVNGLKHYKYFVARTLKINAYVVLEDGVPVVSNELIQNNIDSLNKEFSTIGIMFSLCKIEQISNPAFSEIEIEADCSPKGSLLKDFYTKESINLYFVDKIIIDNELVSSFVNMPDDDKTNDYMFFAGISKYMLMHTFGHFFGLYHTHESEEWGSEMVRNNNNECYHSGDLICDTPAEPDLSITGIVRADCEYNGFEMIDQENGNSVPSFLKDSNGDIYVPSVTNFMAHVPSLCAIMFTPEQYYRMSQIYKTFYTYLK